MRVTFIQTADALFYQPMLAETSRTVREFCLRNGFSYEQYVGLKRGHVPWHAAYNRVYMLKELMDRQVDGWVLYMDADAFITDLDFDLKAFLRERDHYAGIFAGYINDVRHDINSGGFAVNLSHPAAKGLIADYFAAVEAIPEQAFNSAIHWERDIDNDQHLLHVIMERYCRSPALADLFLFERTNQSHVNNGPFISQQLRSMHNSFEGRLTAIKERVRTILADGEDQRFREGPGIYLPAGHPRVITGCGTKDFSGVTATGAGGGLIFGPYTYLAAGTYKARVFGRLHVPSAAIEMHGDVVCNAGHELIGELTSVFAADTQGLLIEFPFALGHDAHDLEVRLLIPDGADVFVDALQILPTGTRP